MSDKGSAVPEEGMQATHTSASSGAGADAGTPRWVKVFAILGIAVLAVFVILMLTGGGSHGPGRHAPADDRPSNEAPPATQGGVHGGPPAGVRHPWR